MKGTVEVRKNGLEARFAWTPDPSGDVWDLEALRSLLAEADVRVEVPDSVLEEALGFFSSHDEPSETDVIAAGVKPVEPIPFRVEIRPAPLPAVVKESLEAVLRDALPTDDEVVYGWAAAADSLGTVTPAVAARAGLALNRDPIAPPEQTGNDFELGENLEVRGSDLIAETDGIVRIGKARADLVPCRLHEWSLTGGPSAGGCFLNYRPGHPSLPVPAAPDIVAAAGKLGYLPEKLRPEEEIRALVAEAASDGVSLEVCPLSLDTDGSMTIETDSMRLRADLHLRKSSGDGKPLVLNEIAAAIRHSGLRGLDGPAVKAAIMAFWKGGEADVSIPLKQGVEPERGPDRELEYLVPFLEEQDAAPIRERLVFEPDKVRGILSLREFPPEAVSKMAAVESGQAVGRLGAATAGKSGRDIDGKELPGYPGNDPDVRIHEGLGWDGDTIVAAADGLLDVGKTMDDVTHLRVRPHRDALIRITVTDDKIKAFVSTRLPAGTGSSATFDRIRDEAEKAGVVKGLLEREMEEVAERSLHGEIITGHLVAEGRLPMEGGSRLSLSLAGDPAQAPIPVKAGETVGVLASTGEESGWNVLGEPLLDDDSALKVGEYIDRKENDDGSVTLTAAKGGHLVMSEGQLKVRHELDYVGDVSLASGSIRFPGTIKIDGSILSRVVVDGGEGVEVSQVVQAALVNSGGDVFIGKGIKGEGKAVVRTQGKLTLSYAEDANLLATGNITVLRTLMNCRVKCNGRLEFPSGDGKLVGGVMKLKDGLVCKDVGNERETATIVSFGQDYLVESQIEQVRKELEKIQEFISKTDALMEDLERKGAAEKLIQVRRKKVDAMKMLEKKNLKLFLLREKFERHFESEVRIAGTAWPGTTFESHGRLLKVSEPLVGVRIAFDREKGRLERRPL